MNTVGNEIIKLQYNNERDEFCVKFELDEPDYEPRETSINVISLPYNQWKIVLSAMEFMKKHNIRDLRLWNLYQSKET